MALIFSLQGCMAVGKTTTVQYVENVLPFSIIKYENLYEELFKRNVEVKILNNLWELGEAIKKSSLQWSLCRMVNAKPKI
jgi:hypothetical protein